MGRVGGCLRRVASCCGLSGAACICSADMCRRLLGAVEIAFGDGDVWVEGLREVCRCLRVIRRLKVGVEVFEGAMTCGNM